MSWWAWLLVLYAVVGPVVWALCRMSAWQDAEEAQRGLVADGAACHRLNLTEEP